MKCPKDQTKMDELKVDAVTLDVCPECDGIWMDWGELSKIAGINASEYEAIYKGGSDIPCPRCGKKMNKADLHSVDVEECKCGIFFDSGEAEKVIGRDIRPKAKASKARVEVTTAQLKELLEKGSLTLGGLELVLKR